MKLILLLGLCLAALLPLSLISVRSAEGALGADTAPLIELTAYLHSEMHW